MLGHIWNCSIGRGRRNRN